MVIKAFAHGDTQTAAGNIEVNRLIEAARMAGRVFVKYVTPRNAEVGRAILDISRDDGGAHNDDAQIGSRGLENELAGTFRVVLVLYSGGCKQRQGFLKDAPLGKGQGQGGGKAGGAHWAFPGMRSISAPRARSFSSMRS